MSKNLDLGRDVAASAFGMLPFFGWSEPIVRRLLQAQQEQHERAVSRALDVAERISGLSRDEIGERVADDPALIPLLIRLLYAAGMNGFDDVLEAMGASLGEALTDPSKVDDAEVVIQAIQGLSRHHIRVLNTAVASQPTTVVDGEERPRSWTAEALSEASGFPQDLTELCLAGLVNAGLVRVLALYDGMGYQATDTGVTVLAALEARSSTGRSCSKPADNGE